MNKLKIFLLIIASLLIYRPISVVLNSHEYYSCDGELTEHKIFNDETKTSKEKKIIPLEIHTYSSGNLFERFMGLNPEKSFTLMGDYWHTHTVDRQQENIFLDGKSNVHEFGVIQDLNTVYTGNLNRESKSISGNEYRNHNQMFILNRITGAITYKSTVVSNRKRYHELIDGSSTFEGLCTKVDKKF